MGWLTNALLPLQLILEFEGGLKLAFCDARRFGKIRLQEDPANNEPVSKLGFDPVLEMVNVDEFRQKLAAQRRAIKTVILDQVCVQVVSQTLRPWASPQFCARMPSIAEVPLQDVLNQYGFLPAAAIVPT